MEAKMMPENAKSPTWESAATAEDVAKSLFENGDLAGAERILSSASRLPDAVHSTFYNLGMVRMELEDYAGAIEAYSQVDLNTAPDASAALLNRGFCYEKVGLSDNAESDYRRALDIDADDVDVLVNLGTLLLAQGQPHAALIVLQRAARLDETINYLLFDAYYAIDDFSAAETAARRAIESGENRAMNDLVFLLETQGRLTEAAEVRKTAARLGVLSDSADE